MDNNGNTGYPLVPVSTPRVRDRAQGRGQAIAGMICGIASIAYMFIIMLVCLIMLAGIGPYFGELMDEMRSTTNSGYDLAPAIIIYGSMILSLPIVPLAAGIVGLIMSKKAGELGYMGGMRNTGFICSIIGVCLGAMVLLIGTILVFGALLPIL